MAVEKVKTARPVNYVAGITAGLVAGAVLLGFFVPVDLIVFYLQDPFLARNYGSKVLPLLVQNDLPYSIVVGLVLGVVFAATQHRLLKGLALELKGMIYGIAFWLAAILPTILLQPLAREIFLNGQFIISIVGYLIFGLVLGNLYKRFSSKLTTQTMAAPSSPSTP